MTQTIEKYTLIKQIGSGATSVVYLAEDEASGEQVAIKLLNESLMADEAAQERFAREVAMVQRLNHPAIVPVLGHGVANGRSYIVMPYFAGGSLRDRLHNQPLTLDGTLDVLTQLAPAIDAAHEANILHRDIKPHNVLVGENGRFYLTDFGIARLINRQAGQTETMTLIGTPEFMAPEQVVEGKLTPQTDLYQLAVTTFFLLTASYPFSGGPLHIMARQLNSPAPSICAVNPTLPVTIDSVLARGMAKEATARFQTASAFVDALRAAADGVTQTMLLERITDNRQQITDNFNSQQSTANSQRLTDGSLPFTIHNSQSTIHNSPVSNPQSPIPNNRKPVTGLMMFGVFAALVVLGAFLMGQMGMFARGGVMETAVPTTIEGVEANTAVSPPLTRTEENVEAAPVTESVQVEDAVAIEMVEVEEEDDDGGETAVLPSQSAQTNQPPADNNNNPPPPRNNNGDNSNNNRPRDGNGNNGNGPRNNNG